LTWSASADEIAMIRAALPIEVSITAPVERPGFARYEAATEDLVALAPSASLIMGWIAPRAMLEVATALEILVWLHSGMDSLDKQYLVERNVPVANVRGSHAAYIAEQAFALMLGLAKRLVDNNAAVHAGYRPEWWGEGTTSAPLIGSTVVIVGLGRVGREIARRAGAFGMHRIGVRATPADKDPDVEEIVPPEDLMSVLPKADFVILAVPLTAATRGLIGEAALRSMKQSAFLINVARGHIVSEPALYQAITEDWIAGFASDVWWDYGEGMPTSYHFPVPSRTSIHRHPHVLGSGDSAANLLVVRDRMILGGCASLAEKLADKPITNLVKLERGY
jgi:phosphoglycerate dehydrogenase-like enzyme